MDSGLRPSPLLGALTPFVRLSALRASVGAWFLPASVQVIACLS